MNKAILFFIPILLIWLSQPSAEAGFIPFETIDKGEISYFRYGDDQFSGGDMVIRDPGTWAWFWQKHTAGITPERPVPFVEFKKEMVLVSLLGYQTSGGGPDIEIQYMEEIQSPSLRSALNIPTGIRVFASDNRKPGLLDVITNPFHLVKVKNFTPNTYTAYPLRYYFMSVLFEHQPADLFTGCTGNQDCAATEFCSFLMGNCSGPGSCQRRPEACPMVYLPVCGCDNRTYGSACEAASSGINVKYQGACGMVSPRPQLNKK